MIGSNLHRFYKGKYLLFDKETEGLNLAYSRPWQLAWAIADNNRIIDLQTRYIKWPNINVSKGAAAVTGFKMSEYLRLAKDPEEVLEEFDKYFLDPQYILLGHNILGYDLYVYKTWRKILGRGIDFDDILSRLIDTDCLSRGYKKQIRPDPSNLLQWQIRAGNIIEKGLKTNLAAMGREFNIDFDYKSLHQANNDLKLNHLVFKELLWKMDF